MSTHDQKFCNERMHHAGTFDIIYCSRKPKRDGFCSQHHPDAVAERRCKADRRYRLKFGLPFELNDLQRGLEPLLREVQDFPSDPESWLASVRELLMKIDDVRGKITRLREEAGG